VSLDIKITTVPKHLIRAEQSGDWWFNNDFISAAVLEGFYPPDYELMIGIHEVIEAWLCRKLGITDEQVVKFDTMYEAERQAGKHQDNDEPGDDPRSPYRLAHMAATHVERAVGSALDVSWKEHERLLSLSAEDHQKKESPVP
jgi:hypothetical protein